MIYAASKKVIQGGNYEHQSMLNKLDLYLLGNRITEAQYTELVGFIEDEQATK